ncbi:hypothetical protein V6N13_076376 [Hibiscus sabdariffa]|uniref:Uncharacterized protein n=2 Tax=Hibiscus sabdariffa TaxID=183260 RepID=A0ABR2B0D2_9ROSI
MTEHHHQGLVFEGGGEKNGKDGMVVGRVGRGGIVSFGRVGSVGKLGSGGRAPGLGNDGCVVGNVGCGRLGIDGSGGSDTPGNVGGTCRR